MSKKGSNFFEEHVEKIVLGIVGAVCLWFLITRVVLSPNVVEYENKKLSASRIDEQLTQQAGLLENKISQKPKEATTYKAQIGTFAAEFNSAIGKIDSNLCVPLPASTYSQVIIDRKFAMPAIGQIKGIDAEHIRAVAFVPKEAINEESLYENAETEPNDMDIVTVEGKFDVAGLYERFYANFAGDNVPNERWRDPCLAIPVFAAVQLQRQEMLSDRIWSDWEIVPRTRIDHRKKLFELVEDVRQLPAGGVRIRLLRFNDPLLRREMLQPGGYKIASVGEKWYPPSLHREFLKNQQSLRAQEKHEAKMASKEKEESRSSSRQRTDSRTRSPKGGEEGSGGGISIIGSSSPKRVGGPKNRPDRPSEEATKVVTDVPTKFNDMLLSPTTDPSRMSGPLDFWAIDDTVQAGKTYRYRMRLGVFNPVAGTDQFQDKDKHFQNDVVLWSDFSDVTKNIEVPAILYFFPRDVQEVAGAVTVQVSKYVFGNWYSKDFIVKKGEAIGKIAKTEVKEEKPDVFVPELINYDTGAVVVDIVPVNDWSGSKGLHSRSYYDMLYSFDGTKIEHVPIKKNNWDDKMQAKFNEIKRAEKEPKVTLHAWKSTTLQQMQQKSGITIQSAGE
jgi:hypothetical protein